VNHPLDERALQDAWNREWAFAEGWPKEKTSLWVVVRSRDQTDVEFADGVVALWSRQIDAEETSHLTEAAPWAAQLAA
jgi:hypothetical protein